MPFALAAVYRSTCGAPFAKTVASFVPEAVRVRHSRTRATCGSSEPATMAPMSSARIVAARRRTGSGNGREAASLAQRISSCVFAPAWARA